MHSQYASEYNHQLVRNHGPTNSRRKSSDVSSSGLSVIVLGGFGLKRAGTAVKCRQCGLLVGPNEDSEHQLTCAIKQIDLKPDDKSSNKRLKWLKKWKQNATSNKIENNNNEKSKNNSNRKEENKSIQNERPGTATLDKPSVLDLTEITSIDMTLSVKALNNNAPSDDPIPRPETVTLLRPTPNLNTPNVPENFDKSSVSVKHETQTPRRLISKTTKGRSRTRRDSLKSENQISKYNSTVNLKDKLPVPCKSCVRSTLPERLHSHGTPGAFKAHLGAIKRKKKSENSAKATSNHKKLISNNSHHNSNKTKSQRSFSVLKSLSSTNIGKTSKSKSTANKKQLSNKASENKIVVPVKPVNSETLKVPNDNQPPKPVKKAQSKSEPSTTTSSPARMVTSDVEHDRNTAPEESDLPKRPSKGGPRGLLCYICGKNFGTSSLPIHEPKCLEKWRVENEKLPANLRRQEPQKPDLNYDNASREEQNDAAWQTFSNQLLACSLCNRTFFPDRLPIHMKACKGKEGGKNQAPPPSQTKKPKQKNISRIPPNFVTCYICGRGYGNTSIGIHERHCIEAWRNENNNLPKELQRQEPVKPDIQYTDDGNVDVEATRDALWRSHLDQLVPCTNCGRTFYPDRLVSHQRGCKSNSFKL